MIQKKLIFVVLFIGSIFMFLPFLWLLLSTFKSNPEIVSVPPTFFPKKWTFDNFVFIVKEYNILTYFKNSLFLAVVRTALGLYTSLLCGYVFAKFEFRFKKIIFSVVLFSMMVPYLITVIPTYQMINSAGLIDTYLAVALPTLYSSFGIFMMRQYMTSAVPDELLEAARIEGANEFKIFHAIAAPLAVNMLIALGIFMFLWNWEDFLWPYLVLTSKEKLPIAVALSMFAGRNTTNYGGLFAATAITIIPILIAYLFFQKRFVESMALSGVK